MLYPAISKHLDKKTCAAQLHAQVRLNPCEDRLCRFCEPTLRL
jgi:hypothetical protein